MSSTPNITELRTQLLATLADLRNREQPMEPDRARAVAQVAAVLVDSAKVEVEFLRATHGTDSSFLNTSEPGPVDHPEGAAGNGITSVRRHLLK